MEMEKLRTGYSSKMLRSRWRWEGKGGGLDEKREERERREKTGDRNHLTKTLYGANPLRLTTRRLRQRTANLFY